jgi:hypothetical protein
VKLVNLADLLPRFLNQGQVLDPPLGDLRRLAPLGLAQPAKNSLPVLDGAVLVAENSTAEDRAHALVETKQLAEQKGRIETQIVELERDRARYERDLETYRATLAANR